MTVRKFTLVELLVSMAVLSIFMLGLIQFFSTTQNAMTGSTSKLEMFERARIAFDLISSDLTCIYYNPHDNYKYCILADEDKKAMSLATVRPNKPADAKSSIAVVRYRFNDNTLTMRTIFDNDAAWSLSNLPTTDDNAMEIIDGVESFEITFSGGSPIPKTIEVTMTLMDQKSIDTLNAAKKSGMKETQWTKVKENILHGDAIRVFKRKFFINRGQYY